MPVVPPALNNRCDIIPYVGAPPRALNVPCQLKGQDRRNDPYIVQNVNGLVNSNGWLASIIMPPRQDVRGPGQFAVPGDRICIPAGQVNCCWIVQFVYDEHRNEPNEFRVAICVYEQFAAGPLQ